jgi:hypothetical protein
VGAGRGGLRGHIGPRVRGSEADAATAARGGNSSSSVRPGATTADGRQELHATMHTTTSDRAREPCSLRTCEVTTGVGGTNGCRVD